MQYEFLVPYPRKIKIGKQAFAKPRTVRVSAPGSLNTPVDLLRKDLRSVAKVRVAPRADFTIALKKQKRGLRPEGYKLRLNAKGVVIAACDDAGFYYATQTLLQFFAFADAGDWRPLTIEDWPQYKLRSFMIDMGRAVFPLALLKRTVRILARLKMNVLHMHINDDQLNSLRFTKLPLGTENPTAITLAQLKALVAYAKKYHVRIMPEFECWGHAGSAIHHFPELYGGPGMWGGMSFGMGEETFDFFGDVFDELLPVLEKDCLVHVGLDEAVWSLLPSVSAEKEKDYSPTVLVARLDDILCRLGRKHKRTVTTHMWADHGGRPLPKSLKCRTVIEPWMYFEGRKDDIRDKVRKYSGKNKIPFMMGGGMSSVHHGGHYGATKYWCRYGAQSPNCEGITICFWEANDLAEKLIGLYGGADFAWSPETPTRNRVEQDAHSEYQRGSMGVQMKKWQAAFRDADTEGINKDRGPEVYRGFYCWGKLAGKPVAPTAWVEVPHHGGNDDLRA